MQQTLVPSHGLVSPDQSLDNIGPNTRTVAQNAALLDVLADADWRDPSTMPMRGDMPGYPSSLDRQVQGMRITVVAESLDPCDVETRRYFERDCGALAVAGVTVTTASVPLWSHSTDVLMTLLYAAQATMIHLPGRGYAYLGRSDPGLAAGVSADEQTGIIDRAVQITSRHLSRKQPGRYPGHAQNLRIALRGQVEAALRDVDLLVTPTTPIRPHPMAAFAKLAGEVPNPLIMAEGANTRPLNLTGHPALSVPTGLAGDGLPTAVQFVGRNFDEPVRTAQAPRSSPVRE